MLRKNDVWFIFTFPCCYADGRQQGDQHKAESEEGTMSARGGHAYTLAYPLFRCMASVLAAGAVVGGALSLLDLAYVATASGACLFIASVYMQ